jgi:hypothetical protein
MEQCKLCAKNERECNGQDWVIFYNNIQSKYDPTVTIQCICKEQALKKASKSPKYIPKPMK